jgi:hypothetical protein
MRELIAILIHVSGQSGEFFPFIIFLESVIFVFLRL